MFYIIPSKGFSEIAEEIKICDLKENVNLKNIFKNIYVVMLQQMILG